MIQRTGGSVRPLCQPDPVTPAGGPGADQPSFDPKIKSIEASGVSTQQPALTPPGPVTARTLREAIATELERLHPDDVARECARLGLETPPDDEATPWSGKWKYVERRLRPLGLAALVPIAQQVIATYDSQTLHDMIGRIGAANREEATGKKDVIKGQRITSLTRRRIRDEIAAAWAHWAGDLEETKFLSRLYNLDDYPSEDYRYPTAAGDIFQHRVNNHDWDDDWIFTDERFDVATTDKGFLQLLAESLHPVVRADETQVQALLGLYNRFLRFDGYEIVQVAAISGAPVYGWRQIGQGATGRPKNLIFATLSKPDVVLRDAIDNDLGLASDCSDWLIYDRPIPADGITWHDLADWWADKLALTGVTPEDVYRDLYGRLARSVDNSAERRIFEAYGRRYAAIGPHIPALLPQIWLYYDPRTAQQRGRKPVLPRQRMDFLLLCPGGIRIVIECDGQTHYGDEPARPSEPYRANPHKYAQMVSEDRELRLRGYEVFRFGGAELTDSPATPELLARFFDRLADRYSF